jgi:predicted acyltransferase
VFSFASRLARDSSRQALVLHTLWRSGVLFIVGLALNGMAALQTGSWRIPGVLQRIAIVYCAAALITLFTKTRGRALWIAVLALGYWVVMRYVPVPGYGVPGVDIPLLHPDGNLAAHIDRRLMLGHLWQTTHDPEGILSTFPAIATALLGVLTGEWLRSSRPSGQKAAGMLAGGVACIVVGELWGHWFPVNKSLWTSSYVFLTAGAALVCLALCYWATDIRLHRGSWTRPFLVFGTNAITAYVLSEVVGGWLAWKGARLFHWLTEIHPAALASLLHSLIILGLCFVPVWLMYRNRIIVKI